jgi:selenocysteine-specific elongation factor
VTGTLAAGTLRVGDELLLRDRPVRIRGLQSLGEPHDTVPAVARVAVNLRGVERDEVGRGDVLLTAGAWRTTRGVDVRLSTADRVPEHLVLHAGSTAVPVRVRALGDGTARLLLPTALPLRAGDRALLRDPGEQRVVSGVLVLDADPPALRRRGAAAARAAALGAATGTPDLVVEVERRGAVPTRELLALGVQPQPADGVREVAGWWVADATWQGWVARLGEAVDAYAEAHRLEAGMPSEAARAAVGLPDLKLLAPLTAAAALEQRSGRLRRPGAVPSLGVVEPAVQELETQLAADPFAAPEAPDLQRLGLGPRELAAAETAGRLLRISPDVVLLPSAPALAMRVLAGLGRPFTVSDARQALGTTRRVAVPLLEHLDRRGWTVRLDGALRRVASPG